MPLITRTLIKTAMLWAIAGMLLSAAWLLQLAIPMHPLVRFVQPTALHLVVVGWLTQLIFGIALWMFPPWTKAQPRGPDAATWACYGLLNAGLLLRLIAEPLNSYRPGPILGLALVVAALLQVAAIAIFVVLAWTRVRAKAALR